MRAVVIHKKGQPRTLRVEEVPEPTAGRGEVLIQVRAVGVNFADVLARQGLYPDAPPCPFIPGYESGGEILALGEGVTDLAVSQRVLAYHTGGGYAERVAVPAAQVFPIPDSLSTQAAVVLPLNYGTAYISLYHTGRVEPGMRLYMHAAAGGVGMAAVDLAKRAGLEVVGAASSHYKRERLQAEGVKYVMDSRKAKVDRVARQLYGDSGFDIVIDSVGGRTIVRGMRALRAGGRLVSIGVGGMSGRGILGALAFVLRAPRLNALRLLQESRGFYGVNLAKLIREPKKVRGLIEDLIRLAAAREIHPEPGRVLMLDEAAHAHRLLETRRNVGKIVLRP